jgi:hypothetical protein
MMMVRDSVKADGRVEDWRAGVGRSLCSLHRGHSDQALKQGNFGILASRQADAQEKTK